MGRQLLKGTVSEGMFPTERSVAFEDHLGNAVSLIIPASAIIQLTDGTFIPVRLVDSDGGLALILLPGEVFGAGKLVTVQGSELREEVGELREEVGA